MFLEFEVAFSIDQYNYHLMITCVLSLLYYFNKNAFLILIIVINVCRLGHRFRQDHHHSSSFISFISFIIHHHHPPTLNHSCIHRHSLIIIHHSSIIYHFFSKNHSSPLNGHVSFFSSFLHLISNSFSFHTALVNKSFCQLHSISRIEVFLRLNILPVKLIYLLFIFIFPSVFITKKGSQTANLSLILVTCLSETRSIFILYLYL